MVLSRYPRVGGFSASVSVLTLCAGLSVTPTAAVGQGAGQNGDLPYTADDIASFTYGEFSFDPYAGIGITGGASYTVAGFATENPPGTLVNPASSLEVTTEGRVYFAGVNITNQPEVREWLRQEGGVKPGFYRNFLGVRIEVDRNTMEGRVYFTGNYQNFGVPGLGDQFGFFDPSNAIVDQFAHINYKQIGATMEGRLGSYFVIDNPLGGSGQVGVAISGLFGVILSSQQTEITNHAVIDYTTLVSGEGWARYWSQIDQTSISPFIGASIDKDIPLANGAVVSTGVAVRGGITAINWSVYDTLRAQGFGGAIDRFNTADLQGTESGLHGSVSAYAQIDWQNGWSAKAGGKLQHGLVRSADIFRPDSVETSPGNFELAGPQVTFAPQTVLSGTIEISRKF
jgi:hypothetical protein